MKNLLIALFTCCTIIANAQSHAKIDSIYYLLDTANTPINDRLWDVHEEYPSLKLYIIKCPCLPFDNQPTFVYNIGIAKDQTISKKDFNIKLVSLETLISKAKQIANNSKLKTKYSFFIIELKEKKYVLHHVRLLNISKPPKTTVDFRNISGNDSTKLKK